MMNEARQAAAICQVPAETDDFEFDRKDVGHGATAHD